MDYCQQAVEALAAEQNRLRDALGAISKLFLDRPITYEDARNLDIVIGRKMWIDYYKQQTEPAKFQRNIGEE